MLKNDHVSLSEKAPVFTIIGANGDRRASFEVKTRLLNSLGILVVEFPSEPPHISIIGALVACEEEVQLVSCSSHFEESAALLILDRVNAFQV